MRLPGSQHRISIFGRTGSGKTQAAVWHLSTKNFESMPWIVFNHKRTALINSIPGAKMVDIKETVKKPGLYIYQPIPDVDDERVTEIMWDVWRRGKTGVFFDEGYMIDPRDKALTALYTQGRELQIPMITLSQRPSHISRFGVSEADFYQVFHLTDKKDRERVGAFIPYSLEAVMGPDAALENRMLPEFHSIYYDVGKNDLAIFKPVPDEDAILGTFEDKLILSKKKNYLL